MNIEASIKKTIEDAGMTIRAVSKKTGIEYWKLQTSLSGRREMRADEFLDLCAALSLDPMKLVNEAKGDGVA